ncbi:MAG: PAS domain-containing protein [Tepidisphaeraceae bacterium]
MPETRPDDPSDAARALEAERLRQIFDRMDDGFCVIQMIYDPDGRPVDYRFREFNPAFTVHTGIRPEDALAGKTVRELFPGHETHWFEIYGEVARTGVPQRFENRAEAIGRWYDVHAFRIGGDGSHEVGVLFKDVSARRQAEELERATTAAMLQSAARLTAAVSVANLGVWEWDVPDRCIRMDARSRQIWGIEQDDENVEISQLIPRLHPGDRERITARIAATAKDADTRELEYRLVWPDGSIRTIVSSGEAFRSTRAPRPEWSASSATSPTNAAPPSNANNCTKANAWRAARPSARAA